MSEQPPADGGQQQYPPPPGPFGPGQVPGASGLYGGATGPRASFGQRFGASLLDGVILGVPFYVLVLILRGSGAAIAILYVVWIVAEILYFGLLEGGPTGQTVGKRVANIRVIDARTGGPIGFWRAILRLFSKIVSAIPCYLGYFWMLWDSEKQCWHDKIATDYVVPVAAYPVQQ